LTGAGSIVICLTQGEEQGLALRDEVVPVTLRDKRTCRTWPRQLQNSAEYFLSEATLTRSIACIQIVRFWMTTRMRSACAAATVAVCGAQPSAGARRMRCWRADSATDVELAVALGHGRPPERQRPGEHAVAEVQAGDLGEDPLRSPDHRAGPDVVGRAVPGANQAAVLVDAAARQVSAKVAAPPRDREV